MFETVLTTVVAVSGLIYGLVEVVKPIYDPAKRANLGDMIAALIFAEVVCVGTGFDVFPIIGFPFLVPFVGAVLTAFLVVGAGKGVHDGIQRLKPA
jgi:hypothetical protein